MYCLLKWHDDIEVFEWNCLFFRGADILTHRCCMKSNMMRGLLELAMLFLRCFHALNLCAERTDMNLFRAIPDTWKHQLSCATEGHNVVMKCHNVVIKPITRRSSYLGLGPASQSTAFHFVICRSGCFWIVICPSGLILPTSLWNIAAGP